ncbi:MAG: transcriptional repressor LexA [bacterium]
MDGLTSRQQEILAFIRGFVESEGMPPTRAELARAFGFKSPASAEEHLRALEKKGAITLSGMARGLRLTEPSGLPLVGQVAAGAPLLAAENVVGHYPVNPNLFKLRADYLLKVRGWSMRDAGILDGDWLVVHKASEARDGQIVVARVDDEVTVKRLKRKAGRAYLIAENPEFSPIVIELARTPLVIEGIAIGVVRDLNAI